MRDEEESVKSMADLGDGKALDSKGEPLLLHAHPAFRRSQRLHTHPLRSLSSLRIRSDT
jgi:hypothetical protein